MNKILIVDDEPSAREIMGDFLKAKGFSIAEAADGEEALKKAESFQPYVILLDIRMPVMDGIEALGKLNALPIYAKIIMVSASDDLETAVGCMKKGAYSYLPKPVNLESLFFEIERALEHREMFLKLQNYQKDLEAKVGERTKEVEELNSVLKGSFLNSVRILSGLLEAYDPFLGGHSKRVAFLSTEIATKRGFTDQELFDLEVAALLHDIGTLGIPDRVKNAQMNDLSKEEQELIKKHPSFAQNLLSTSKEFDKAGIIIKHHLEKIDGSGFPGGLPEGKIPLASKIIGTVNAYDEARERRRFTEEKLLSSSARDEFALKHVKRLAGKHFMSSIITDLEMVVLELQKRKKGDTRLNVNGLSIGMVLATNLVNNSGMLLISKGSKLTAVLIDKIKAFHDAGLIASDIVVKDKK